MMARLFDGTPEGLTDDTGILDKPKREKPIQVAEIPPAVRERMQPSAPAAPAAGATPTRTTPTDPGELVREQARLKREREELEASAKKAGQAQLGKRYQQIRAEYEPKLSAPAPQFEAPKESFAQLGALGAMMMVMGTMGGGKGLTSATGAMNAMAGMMQGYQQGRKDVFDRAKAEFEQNYKVWQENKKNIKEAFDRAIKFAPYDIQAATNKAVAELNSKGATTLAASVKTQGLQATANQYASANDKADKEIETMNDSIRRMAGERPAQADEVGVALAGEIPQGTRLTRGGETPAKPETAAERLKRLKRQEGDVETELEVLKARKQYAPPAPVGGADYQFVQVEGEPPFRASAEEREQLRKSGLNFKYVAAPKSPEQEPTYDVVSPRTGKLEKMPRSEYEALRAKGEAPQLAGEAKAEKTDAEKKQEEMDAIMKAVGPRATLARLLGPEVALATQDEKVAKEIVDNITSIRSTLDLVKQANDPEIRFGEVGRSTDRFLSYVRRNLGQIRDEANPEEATRAIDRAASEAGMDRNDKNIVFYKEAIFTALEVERAARGGSILPVAFMKTLTPLLDPRNQTREQFTEIFMRRANEVARKSGLTQDQISKGIQGVQTFRLTPESITGGGQARQLSPADQQALDWANSNPTDPRSRAIKQRLGVQ